MVLSGQKRSKVLARRHGSSISSLLHHSQRLHHAFAALDREESRVQRRLSLNALPARCAAGHISTSNSNSSAQGIAAATAVVTTATAGVATVKPLVFRKTKREIERERASQAQLCIQQQQQQLQDMASSLRARSMRPTTATKVRPSCRAEFLCDARSLRIGERGRSRRRLLF